ncbi:hypothetical protein BOX15_Mlig027450g1, partial [Macrostomum lignano]
GQRQKPGTAGRSKLPAINLPQSPSTITRLSPAETTKDLKHMYIINSNRVSDLI